MTSEQGLALSVLEQMYEWFLSLLDASPASRLCLSTAGGVVILLHTLTPEHRDRLPKNVRDWAEAVEAEVWALE